MTPNVDQFGTFGSEPKLHVSALFSIPSFVCVCFVFRSLGGSRGGGGRDSRNFLMSNHGNLE